MNNDKMIQYVKRWQQLERKSKELDYERSVFAKELRSEFGNDAQFIKWCADELGLTATRSSDLLLRATAAKAVPDASTWSRIGGFREIGALAAVPDRKTQIHIIESAKSTGKGIRTLIRENVTHEPPPPRTTPARDAEELARFIVQNVPEDRLTENIRAVVARYVRAIARAA